MSARAGAVRLLALTALVASAACSPDPTAAAGTARDARTGAPLADLALTLTPDDPKCTAVTSKTDATGAWTASGLCGEAAWTVAPTDPGWRLAAPVPATAATTLELWRAPPDAGVYLLAADAITPLATHTLLDTVRIFDTTEEVRFPVEIPGVVPRVASGGALLLVGDVLPELTFAPLVPSPERRWFGTKDAPLPVDPWVYLGVRFTSDTAYERVPVALDAAKVTRAPGDLALTYVASDALPPGRYALPDADGKRAFLLDFGDPTP